MQILDGDIKKKGTVAFASQDPWIVNGTARENILFGRPFEKDWYRIEFSFINYFFVLFHLYYIRKFLW